MTIIARRAELRDGAPAARPNASGSATVGPCVRARDRQPEVARTAARRGRITTRDVDRLDTEEAGGRDGIERQDVQAHARTPEAGRIAERVELDGERERSRGAAQPWPWSNPPTCSSSFQATSASPFTNARKSQNVMTSVRRSVVAVTVAVRTRSLMRATSPK